MRRYASMVKLSERGVTANIPVLGTGDSGFESRRSDKKIEYNRDMIRKIVNFFDRFEDHIRGHLSRYPILYTIIGGLAIVLFWRGVWHTADILQAKGGILGFIFYEPVSLLIVTAILLATGLFVSYFIGDAILLSGVKSQKKLAERTDKEIQEEEASLLQIKHAVQEIQEEVHQLKKEVQHEHKDHMHHVVHEKQIKVLEKTGDL